MTVTHVVRLLTIFALALMLLAVQIDPTAERGVIGDLLLGPPVASAGFLLSAWLLHQGSAIENFKGPHPNCTSTLSAAPSMQLLMI
jgi:hypothetical protein